MGPSAGRSYTLNDGLGTRALGEHAVHGRVEILTVSTELAEDPDVEAALRAGAVRAAASRLPMLTSVHAIESDAEALRVVANAPAGIRLSDLLSEAEAGREELTDAAALDIATAIVQAVAAVHEVPGGLAHGAVSPAHIILTREGQCLLTDAIFGGALEALRQNRGSLWREFGVALPSSASVHRFDQRADVTQLGAVILALLLGRALHADEYPRAIGDLVVTATPTARGAAATALRMWLQQALQLHPRASFNSAVAARQAFSEILEASGVRRPRRQARAFPMLARLDTMAAARCGIAR